MVLSLGTAAAAVGFVNAMQASAIATEAMTADNRARELELVRAEAQLRASTTSRRVLHDDVLGTLHLISDGVAPADRIRRQCRATVAAIRSRDRQHDGARTTTPRTGSEQRGPGRPPGVLRRARATTSGRRHRCGDGERDRTAAASCRALSDAQRSALAEGAARGRPQRRAARRSAPVTLRISVGPRGRCGSRSCDRGAGLAPTSAPGSGSRSPSSARSPRWAARSALAARAGRRHRARPDHAARPARSGAASTTPTGSPPTASAPMRTLSRAVAHPARHGVVRHRGPRRGAGPATWHVAPRWAGLAAGHRPSIVRRVRARRARTALGGRSSPSDARRCRSLGIALLPAGAMLDFRSWSIGMSALPLVVFVLSLPVVGGLRGPARPHRRRARWPRWCSRS